MNKFSDWHIYFSGAGFSCAFYIGVVKALQERFPNEIPIVSADSAGALVGLSYAFNIPWYETRDIYLQEIQTQENRNNEIFFGKVSNDHDDVISRLLEKGDFKKIQLNDRFRIGLTKPFMKYQVITNWKNEREIREYAHRSMTIPFVVKTRYSLDLDGAISNDQMYDLTIGTTGENDISIYQSMSQKLTPPTKKEVDEMIESGYLLTMNYDFSKRKKHLPFIRYKIMKLIVLWILKFISMFMKMCNIVD